MIKPKILWQGSIIEDQLVVNLIDSSKSNRAVDLTVESKLQDVWEQQLAESREKGTILYDGISYRLEEFKFDGKKLVLIVSRMKYHIRNTLKKMSELEDLGEAYYSHGLSIGGFVVTTDDVLNQGYASNGEYILTPKTGDFNFQGIKDYINRNL